MAITSTSCVHSILVIEFSESESCVPNLTGAGAEFSSDRFLALLDSSTSGFLAWISSCGPLAAVSVFRTDRLTSYVQSIRREVITHTSMIRWKLSSFNENPTNNICLVINNDCTIPERADLFVLYLM